MNRETMIAVVFGILLGAGVGMVVLFQTNRAEETKVIPVSGDQDQKKVVEQEAPVAESTKQLVISEPVDRALERDTPVTIKGSVEPGSLIVIQSAADQQVFKNESAAFTAEVDLALGENVILISAYSDSSTPQEQTLRVYYLSE